MHVHVHVNVARRWRVATPPSAAALPAPQCAAAIGLPAANRAPAHQSRADLRAKAHRSRADLRAPVIQSGADLRAKARQPRGDLRSDLRPDLQPPAHPQTAAAAAAAAAAASADVRGVTRPPGARPHLPPRMYICILTRRKMYIYGSRNYPQGWSAAQAASLFLSILLYLCTYMHVAHRTERHTHAYAIHMHSICMCASH